MNKHIKNFQSYIKESKVYESNGISFDDSFVIDEEEMISNEILAHIADMVKNGYNAGELIGEEPNYKGWFNVSIELDEDEDEESAREEIANQIAKGFTKGYEPSYALNANIWKD